MNYLHGKRLRAILTDESDYFYEGRFWVDSWESGSNVSSITIGYDVEPYKRNVVGTLDEWIWDSFNFETGVIQNYKLVEVNGEITLTIIGDTQRVSPIFTSTADMTLTYNGTTYPIKKGTSKIYGVTFGSGSNIVAIKNIMSPALDSAVEDGLIKRNPIRSVKLTIGGRETVHHKALEPETIETVRNRISTMDIRERRMAALLCSTGMRIEEILGLRWEDIDEVNNCIHVQRAVVHPTRNQKSKVKKEYACDSAPKASPSRTYSKRTDWFHSLQLQRSYS